MISEESPKYCRCTSSSVAHVKGCWEGWRDEAITDEPDHPIEECTIDCFVVPPKDKPMTAEERAKKIMGICSMVMYYNEGFGGPTKEVYENGLKEVAEKIRLAENEARKEALACPGQEIKEAYAQGFAEAKKRAAKMADQGDNDSAECSWVADKIRALTPSEGRRE